MVTWRALVVVLAAMMAVSGNARALGKAHLGLSFSTEDVVVGGQRLQPGEATKEKQVRVGEWTSSIGKERDPETGFHAYGWRDWSSAGNHWLAPEPIWEDALTQDAAGLNLYQHTRWNPARFTDSDGRCGLLCAVLLAGTLEVGSGVAAGATASSASWGALAVFATVVTVYAQAFRPPEVLINEADLQSTPNVWQTSTPRAAGGGGAPTTPGGDNAPPSLDPGNQDPGRKAPSARGGNNPVTRDAARRGSALHADKPGHLPDQLRELYPETEFEFTKPGVPGQDVTVKGGRHPSTYAGSTWAPGVDRGDFKPNTPSGARTFRRDQREKWAAPTQMIPYDPKTGLLDK